MKSIKNIEEYTKHVTPEERISFFDSSNSSPVLEISKFLKLIFIGIHGSWSVFGAKGTVYVGRNDTTDTVAVNIDAYSFDISSEGRGKLKGIIKNTEYHHVDEIPVSWKPPRWLINRVEDIERSRGLSSTSETPEGSPEDSSNQI